MASDNIISFEQTAGGARKRMSENRVRQIVGSVRDLASETLPRLIQDLFEHLDDELYELADKSASDVLQTGYFEAMRELRLLRRSIEEDFNQACMHDFDVFWGQHAKSASAEQAAPLVDEAEMSLVEEADLEEGLAIDSMVSKAENRFYRELYALNQRFSALLGEVEVNDDSNPLGPRGMAQGFARALAQWAGETPVRLVVYKLFDRYVMAFAGGLYDDINEVLVEAEVLPKLVQYVRRNPVAPSVQRARDPQHAPSTGVEGTADGELMASLMSLMAERRLEFPSRQAGPWSFAGATDPSLPAVRTGDLLDALSQQQEHVLRAQPLNLDEVQALQGELLGGLGHTLEMGVQGNPTRRLQGNDQDVLDVMGLLFDFILGDESLPEAIKALLGRLQIPLLKVAVSDRRFFSNQQHPARALLNNLARAGIAWNDDGDRSSSSVFGQIESAVSHVLNEFVDDVSVFQVANDQFNRYQERERHNAEIVEERLGQAKRGQEQLEVARQRVDGVLRDYRDACAAPDCILPPPVLSLLGEGWRDVLLLAYLREGEYSTAWNHACEVVEQLIWSVQPKDGKDERQKLLKTIPELLKNIRDGLVNISFDQHRSAVLFSDLQRFHIAALRGERPGADKTEPIAESPRVEVAPEPEVEPSAPVDEFDRLAEALQVGQLLEWQDDSGGWVRGKLSWRSEVSESCIFVDRRGMKVGEMELCRIAALLRAGQARTIEEQARPLMDRALDAMLNALQKTEHSEPQPG